MTILKIIDVSEHNGKIDWERVKPQVDGAIIRCGFGSDKPGNDDKRWQYNVSECERLGIPYGVYLYSYAKTVDAARSEAAHVLRLIKGRRLSYPVYFDAEEPGTEKICKAAALAFGEIIETAGYYCGVYSTPYWFNAYMSGLDRFTKWVASWGTNNGKAQRKPAVAGMDMWQYASVGKIAGITGNVDVGFCYRDFPKEINGTPAAPAESEANMAEPVYKDINDVPEWYRPAVQKLLDVDAINGGTPKNVSATDVNLTQTEARLCHLFVTYVDKVAGRVKEAL